MTPLVNVNVRTPSVPFSVVGAQAKFDGNVIVPLVIAIGSALVVLGAAKLTTIMHTMSWKVRLTCSSFSDLEHPSMSSPDAGILSASYWCEVSTPLMRTLNAAA
jgi:hypothetical protein